MGQHFGNPMPNNKIHSDEKYYMYVNNLNVVLFSSPKIINNLALSINSSNCDYTLDIFEMRVLAPTAPIIISNTGHEDPIVVLFPCARLCELKPPRNEECHHEQHISYEEEGKHRLL